MTHEIVWAGRIASELKVNIDKPIIIGGCHITAMPEETLREFIAFDYGVYGEGEYTMLELINYLEQNAQDIRSINGLVIRDNNGSILVNEPRVFMTEAEFNKLPNPAIYQYYNADPEAFSKENSYYVMLTSRGCPYHCAFCMQVMGNKIRRRSIQNQLGEIEYAIDNYGVHTIHFQDEIFLFNNEFTIKLLQEFIKRRINKKIKWLGLTRVNFVNRDLMKLAKEAGCFKLEMGVESGDDEILKRIGKGFTVAEVIKAVSIIKETGIELMTYYILGHPNENGETLRKTLNLAVKLNTNGIAVGLMVPYPGTKIYNMAIKGKGGYKLISNDWSDYDKYGGKALELNTLPHNELVKWQIKTYVYYYLRNLRLFELGKHVWNKRSAIYYFIRNKLAQLN
jgi:anaerobic magnesium-protoporphyrin IX monomethyl ester cyclase